MPPSAGEELPEEEVVLSTPLHFPSPTVWTVQDPSGRVRREDDSGYRNFLRVDAIVFHEVLDMVHHRIEKQMTFFRKSLDPGLRPTIKLRFLATGDSYKSHQYGFRVTHSTICLIVPETCKAVVAEYMDEVLKCPTMPDGCREVSGWISNQVEVSPRPWDPGWQAYSTEGARTYPRRHRQIPKQSGQ